MEPVDFCRWLQGVFELGKLEELDERQTKVVRDHLNLVFRDVTGHGNSKKLAEPAEDPWNEQESLTTFVPSGKVAFCDDLNQHDDWPVAANVRCALTC